MLFAGAHCCFAGMIKTRHVLQLVEALAKSTGQSKDRHGFTKMSEKIDEEVYVSPRYLDDLYRNAKKKRDAGIEDTRVSGPHVDAIAQHLKFENFHQFTVSCEQKISPVLKSCIGNWWSYVRANSGDYVLKAPVKIYMDPILQDIRMELKGKERVFSGPIEEKAGCLSGFIESEKEKRIGLVFKLGSSQEIELLQGVFCGASSSGDPIAGREILVRAHDISYDEMAWSKHPLYEDELHEKIRKYFMDPGKNCIKIKEVSGFDFNDLDIN
jgi:hypothetical protein